MRRIANGLGLAFWACVVCGLGWSAAVMPDSPFAVAQVIGVGENPTGEPLEKVLPCIRDHKEAKAWRSEWKQDDAIEVRGVGEIRHIWFCRRGECELWDRSHADILAFDWWCDCE